MKRILAILLVVLLFSGCFTSDLKVEGTDEFKQDIHEALDLLQEKAPEHYELVVTYLKRVELVEEGINGVDRYGRFTFTNKAYINRKESGLETISIAVTLVHEGTHAKRIKQKIFNFNDIESEEIIAVDKEIEVAKILGAPNDFINWLSENLKTRWWEQGK